MRSNGEDCAKVTQLQHTESKVLFSPPAKVQRLDSDISFSPSNMLVFIAELHHSIDYYVTSFVSNLACSSVTLCTYVLTVSFSLASASF